MTKEQFDSYRFSIKTQVKVTGEWYQVTEVDFERRKIGMENGYYLGISKIEEIKQSKS